MVGLLVGVLVTPTFVGNAVGVPVGAVGALLGVGGRVGYLVGVLLGLGVGAGVVGPRVGLTVVHIWCKRATSAVSALNCPGRGRVHRARSLIGRKPFSAATPVGGRTFMEKSLLPVV